jgi:hypothetical protein
MPFIKLKNASQPQYYDLPLWLNTDWIISVYPQPTETGSLRTEIYGGSSSRNGKNIWVVEESPEEVIRLIEESEKK